MTKDEIESGVEAIIRNHVNGYHYFSELSVTVEDQSDTEIRIEVKAMYECPPFNSEVVLALCDFFKTKHIDEDRFSNGGCETCDWGSSYGYTLTVRLPSDPKGAV